MLAHSADMKALFRRRKGSPLSRSRTAAGKVFKFKHKGKRIIAAG